MKHNRRHSVLLYNILRLLLVLALLQVPGVGRAQETSVETIFTHPEYQYQLRLKPGWKVTANVDPEKPGQALIEIPSFPSERLAACRKRGGLGQIYVMNMLVFR